MAAITDILEEALSYGVTTMHDVQIYPEFIPLLLKFRDRGGLDNVGCAALILSVLNASPTKSS
jgi:hypothetical protein